MKSFSLILILEFIILSYFMVKFFLTRRVLGPMYYLYLSWVLYLQLYSNILLVVFFYHINTLY